MKMAKASVAKKANLSKIKLEKVKVKWPKSQAGGFAENYSSGLKYALASDNNAQACGFVWCKDFLQDAYLAYFNKNSRSTYGFKYDFNKDVPLSIKSTKLLLANRSDKRFKAKMKKAVDFINQVEVELKMRKKTKAYECIDPPKAFEECGVFLLDGNKRWYASPVMISLYTLLLRVGSKHLKTHGTWRDTCNMMIAGDVSPYQSYDQSQITTALPGIEHIIKYNDRKVFGSNMLKNYPDSIGTSSMHHNSGICAFTQGHTSSNFPGWIAFGTEPPKPKKKPKPCTA